MSVMALDSAATPTVEGKTPDALARLLRAYLQAFTALRLLITYRDLAKAILLSSPHTMHQVTDSLEQLMAEDAATDRPFMAAMIISKWRSGLPAPGFFDCAARLFRRRCNGTRRQGVSCKRVQRVGHLVAVSS